MLPLRLKPLALKKNNPGLIIMLGTLAAFGPLSIDMYLPSFRTIATDLHTNMSRVQYTLASFNIGIAIGQLIYGPLADKLGRKKGLIMGLIIYCMGSIGCAMAGSINQMIALRFLQALGGCSGMVISRAIVRDKYAGDRSARIFSLIMLVMGAAPILAPSLGSFLLQKFSWPWIFWTLAAISITVLIAIITTFEESLKPEQRDPLALKNAFANYGKIIRDRRFLGYSLSLGFTSAGMFAYITGSSFVFIKLYNLNEQAYGMLFGINAIGIVGSSQINGYLLKKYHFDYILRRGIASFAICAIILAISAISGFAGIYGITVPLFLSIATMGFIMPNASAGALQNQAKHAGSASALLGTLSFGCGALSAISVSLLANNTVVPMVSVIAAGGIIGFIVNRSLLKTKKHVEAKNKRFPSADREALG